MVNCFDFPHFSSRSSIFEVGLIFGKASVKTLWLVWLLFGSMPLKHQACSKFAPVSYRSRLHPNLFCIGLTSTSDCVGELFKVAFIKKTSQLYIREQISWTSVLGTCQSKNYNGFRSPHTSSLRNLISSTSWSKGPAKLSHDHSLFEVIGLACCHMALVFYEIQPLFIHSLYFCGKARQSVAYFSFLEGFSLNTSTRWTLIISHIRPTSIIPAHWPKNKPHQD